MQQMYVPSKLYRHVYVVPVRRKLETGQIVYKFRFEEFVEYHEKRDRRVHKVASRRCLANLCNEELTESTVIVTLVGCDQYGIRVPPAELRKMLYFATLCLSDEGVEYVPLWTQSSGKSNTFYEVPAPVFEKLASRFDRSVDAEKFAAYIGLLFSEVTDSALTVVPAKWSEPQHGEDGNGIISPKLFGSRKTHQIRAVVLDLDRWPLLVGKGILTPVVALGDDECYLNDTQIKWAHESVAEDMPLFIAKTAVNDKPGKQSVSFEFVQLLKDVQEVWDVLKERTQEATLELLDLIREGNEVKLLRRLGSLSTNEDGQLLPADRNAISALRSNVPMCAELEQRLGRVFVRELAEKVFVSAGIFGRSYLAIQHDKLGARPMTWAEADAHPERVKCLAFRMPLTSDANVVPFSKALKNGLVHPDAMARMDGDSDGDRIVVIDDAEIVQLFIKHRIGFTVDHKPEKARNESPLAAERMFDLAVQAMADGVYMGALTMRAHNLLAEGKLGLAAWCGWLAQMSPMLLKWDIMIEGVPARAWMALEMDNGIGQAQWKEKQRDASKCNSPRELYNLGIRSPQSIIDWCWNWGIQAVRAWHKTNTLKPLVLPSVARLAWEANPGLEIGGREVRWRRALVAKWGKYWTENYGDRKMSHSALYQELEEIGEKASVAELAALLLWKPKPKETDTKPRTGFALKWHVMGTQWERVLGLRESVQAYLFGKDFEDTLEANVQATVRESLGPGYAERMDEPVLQDEESLW
jgi:hypothetical protein